MDHPLQLLRRAAVLARTGQGNTLLYKRIGNCEFPPPINSGAIVVWPEHEVSDWCAAIIAGASADDLRALVARMVESRGATKAAKQIASNHPRLAGQRVYWAQVRAGIKRAPRESQEAFERRRAKLAESTAEPLAA